jgi:hypothetical protein
MNRWFELSRYGAIALAGPDAAKFLQGLSTNDVRLVGPGRSTLGALCQVNGRVSVLFRVFERGGELVLRLPAPLVPGTLERLRRVVFRARVQVTDKSAELARAGAAGPGAAGALARLAGAAPEREDGAVTAGPHTILRVPGDPPRFEIHAPPADLAPLLEGLAAEGFERGDDGLWTLLEIRAGLPEVEAATVDAFLPQNLDLERLSGLSFSKGCYPGQEVVARTQHLGEIKRRLCRARAAGSEVPAPATPLRALDAGSERDGGKVVRAAPGPDGTIELLAVIPAAELASGARLALGHAAGPRVTPA